MKWVNYLKELPRLGNTFSLFPWPNFLQMKREIPFQIPWCWGESFISLCRWGKWQSLFLHSVQKLLDSAENWRQRAMVWGSAEKNKNNPWLFSFLRAAPDHSQERTNWSGKELRVFARKIPPAREAISIFLDFVKKCRVPPAPKMTYCSSSVLPNT